MSDEVMGPAGAGDALHVVAQPAFRNRQRNPYNFLLYSALQRRGVSVDDWLTRRVLRERCDIVHIHWPTAQFKSPSWMRAVRKSAVFMLTLVVARFRGAAVVWTAHNVVNHDAKHPRAERVFQRAVIRQLDGWIALSNPTVAELTAAYPHLRTLPSSVVPLGHYRDVYGDPWTRQTARSHLSLPSEARVLCYLGRIKPYKNVGALLRAFSAWEDDGAILLVVGDCPDRRLDGEIERLCDVDPRVRRVPEHVPDSDVPMYIGAADLVVAPYTNVLNSSTALLALSLDRPVLLPSFGAMLELQLEFGPGWIRLYDGELTSRHLVDALAVSVPDGPTILGSRDWDSLAEKTGALYSVARAHRSGSGLRLPSRLRTRV